MSSSSLLRLSGLAAVAAGVLFLIGDLLTLLIVDLENPTEPSFVFFFVVLLFGYALLSFGSIGLYVRQSEATGALGLVGFLVAFLGTMLFAGEAWAGIFTQPFLANEAPGLLEQREGPPPGFMLMLATFSLGWLLFGVATLRARVYPRWAAIVLIIGAVAYFLPFDLTAVVFDVAVLWLGFYLFTERGGPAERPTRVS